MKQKHTKYTEINANKSMHSEVWQCDKTQSREVCKNCSPKCAQLQYTTQHRTVPLLSPDKHHSSDVVLRPRPKPKCWPWGIKIAMFRMIWNTSCDDVPMT